MFLRTVRGETPAADPQGFPFEGVTSLRPGGQAHNLDELCNIDGCTEFARMMSSHLLIFPDFSDVVLPEVATSLGSSTTPTSLSREKGS